MIQQAHLRMLDDLALLDLARRAASGTDQLGKPTDAYDLHLLVEELCRRFEPYAFAPDVDPDTDLNFPSNEDTQR